LQRNVTLNEMMLMPTKYVEPENPHLDEFKNDGWVNSTYVKNITTEFDRFTAPIVTKDLKMRYI